MLKSSVGAVLLSSFAWTQAAAQVYDPVPPVSGSPQSIDEVRETYALRAGPFYVDPAVFVEEFGVDTNVFNEYGQQRSDFTFTIAPRADSVLPFGRRGLLKTRLGADFVYFAQYASERSIDPEVAVRGELYARRLTFFAEGSYLNTRQRPNHEIDIRARHMENDLSGGVAFRYTPTLSVELAARHSTVRFDGDAFLFGQALAETLDRDSLAYRVVARYRHSALTTAGVLYENQTDRFPLSPERNMDSFRVMPGVELKPRALINGSAWIGYRRLNPKEPLLRPHAGLVSRLWLSYTLLGATTFGVTYNRDYRFAYEALTPYYIDNNAGVSVRRALGSRYDVIAQFTRFRYDYEPLALDATAPALAFDRVDTIDHYGVNVGYRLRRQTRVGLGVSRWTRVSTSIVRRDYEDLRIGLTMNLEM